MKNRKSVFISLVILALVLTTGAFAYTYPGATAGTLTGGNIVPQEWVISAPSASQPNWESLMPSTIPDAEIIRPVAAGDVTGNDRYPTTGENWDKVDEATADELTTYIYNTSRFYHTDLYNLGDLPVDLPEGTAITKITVYFRFAGSAGTTGYAKAAIRTFGTTFEGAEQTQFGTIFVTRSYQWLSNPATSQAWTIEDINGLQAGVSITKESGGIMAVCTQVYVAVSYDVPVTEGEVPQADLFDITPASDPEYTGDMLVKIYLMNTANITRAYKYLNIELYVEHSIEATKIPHYQVLSIENGVAQFSIEGGNAASYTVEVHGGSYRLISDKPVDWASGWSITPEFYCEVTQRGTP